MGRKPWNTTPSGRRPRVRKPQFKHPASSLLKAGLICAVLLPAMASLSACSMAPVWPNLSISRDEADEAMTKQEIEQLEKQLTTKQKKHAKEAINSIEKK